MKRKVCYLIALLCVCVLAGCGHNHVWKDADCNSPKTCEECGETEGEALGHDYREATCTEPKTCSRCKATEGEALGHRFLEATYVAPATCEACGITEGEKIPSFMEKEGHVVSKQGSNSFLATQYSRNKETGIIFDVDDFELPFDIKITEGMDTEDKNYKLVTATMDMDLTNWSFAYQRYSISISFVDRNTGYCFNNTSEYDVFEPYSLPTKDGNLDVELRISHYMADDYLSGSYTYTLRCPKDYDGALFFVMHSNQEIGDNDNSDDGYEKGKVIDLAEYENYKTIMQKGYTPLFFSYSDN